MGLNDIHSLSHSKWNCKYHVVFAPKYRRKVFYDEKRRVIGDTAKDEGVGIHRISERKKRNNDIRAIRGTEV